MTNLSIAFRTTEKHPDPFNHPIPTGMCVQTGRSVDVSNTNTEGIHVAKIEIDTAEEAIRIREKLMKAMRLKEDQITMS